MLIAYSDFYHVYICLGIGLTDPQDSLFAFFHRTIRIFLGRCGLKLFITGAITFLTIGYGDYYPNGGEPWISGL